MPMIPLEQSLFPNLFYICPTFLTHSFYHLLLITQGDLEEAARDSAQLADDLADMLDRLEVEEEDDTEGEERRERKGTKDLVAAELVEALKITEALVHRAGHGQVFWVYCVSRGMAETGLCGCKALYTNGEKVLLLQFTKKKFYKMGCVPIIHRLLFDLTYIKFVFQ